MHARRVRVVRVVVAASLLGVYACDGRTISLGTDPASTGTGDPAYTGPGPAASSSSMPLTTEASDGGAFGPADGGWFEAYDACAQSSHSGWQMPNGPTCCCYDESFTPFRLLCGAQVLPPVFSYPVADVFGTNAAAGSPLACPLGSSTSPDGVGCCVDDDAGDRFCGELGSGASLGLVIPDGGWFDAEPYSTVGNPPSCVDGGVCCPANSAITSDHLGCCTLDDDGFVVCVERASGSDASFAAEDVVPWPWSVIPPPVSCRGEP